jgi:hypothetical protein
MDAWKAEYRSDSGIVHLSHRYARFGNANLQSRIKTTVRNPPPSTQTPCGERFHKSFIFQGDHGS